MPTVYVRVVEYEYVLLYEAYPSSGHDTTSVDFETFESRLTSFDDDDIGSRHAVGALRCLCDGADMDLRYGANVGVAWGNICGEGKTDGEGHGPNP